MRLKYPQTTYQTLDTTPPQIKRSASIRPVINNTTAPSYETVKNLNNILKNTYSSITTSLHLTKPANDLVKLTINDKHRLITLDIKDLYVNPTKETTDITRTQILKQ